jgi:hypothetical protein
MPSLLAQTILVNGGIKEIKAIGYTNKTMP